MKRRTKKCLALALALCVSSVPALAAEATFEEEPLLVEEEDALTLKEETSEIFSDGELVEPFIEEEIPIIVEGESLFGDGTIDPAMALDDTAARQEWNNGGVSDNRGCQNYYRPLPFAAVPVYSYLDGTENGYMRVESKNAQILIEYYDILFNMQSRKYISGELPLFGGFYSGVNNYYLVYGDNNPGKDDNKEVIRVVKYDKNWNRLGHASLFGANTTKPFDFGTLRMTEYGEYLFVRTCHEMYNGHQATLTMQVNTSDMTIKDAAFLVDFKGGYVSHSFNQFIFVKEDGTLYSLDQGDGYPIRGGIIAKYVVDKATGFPLKNGQYSTIREGVVKFPGSSGDNETGTTFGGFEYSSTHILTAGSSVRLDRNKLNARESKNVFVTATANNEIGKNRTVCRYYSNYPEKSGITVSNPHLVKLNTDKFLLVWEQMKNYKANGKINYIYINGQGRPMSGVYTKNGYLSDCKPIIVDGKVVWYVTDNSAITFYQISGKGNLQVTRKDFAIFASEEVPAAMEFISEDVTETVELLTSGEDLLN